MLIQERVRNRRDPILKLSTLIMFTLAYSRDTSLPCQAQKDGIQSENVAFTQALTITTGERWTRMGWVLPGWCSSAVLMSRFHWNSQAIKTQTQKNTQAKMTMRCQHARYHTIKPFIRYEENYLINHNGFWTLQRKPSFKVDLPVSSKTVSLLHNFNFWFTPPLQKGR